MTTGLPDEEFRSEDQVDTGKFSLVAQELFNHQIKNWKLAADGYQSLSAVHIKKFKFDNFSIEAHFNPGRIISSSAKVDAKSISERPCFLCKENLPYDQKAVKINENYILLVNPYPIFNTHFTIPSVNHVPQLILSEMGNMLSISKMLGKNYSVFYNGPECGASAPDHLHIQAGDFGFMKIDTEHESMARAYGKTVYQENDLKTTAVQGCLRNYFSVESEDKTKLTAEFQKIFYALQNGKSRLEPMMNIICNYNSRWRLLIFPRSNHRPGYFYEEGENNILVSPAAVDLGGVMIFPRDKDFSKISAELIKDIFMQVTLSGARFGAVADKLGNR